MESLRLEAAATPNDEAAHHLIGELSLASAEFRSWWAQHQVHQRTHGTKRLHHPQVGELDVQFESLTLTGDTRQTLYVDTTEPGSSSQDALALLASLAQPWASGALRVGRAGQTERSWSDRRSVSGRTHRPIATTAARRRR